MSHIDQLAIEDEVAAQIEALDPMGRLRGGNFKEALERCAYKVYGVMEEEGRAEIDDEDRGFMRKCILHLLQTTAPPRPLLRFDKFERVICNVGIPGRTWAPGTIQALNEDDPEEPDAVLPYVVKIDPPEGRLISVPKDANTHCRAEVCFGQRAGALPFTLFCMPPKPRAAKRRFAVGDRVACAVEDESDDFTVWAAGTVVAVDYSVAADAEALVPQREWTGAAAVVPYRIELDISRVAVLVHKDEHWLVRDLALQAAGPRQAADGSRCLARLEKRQRVGGGGWEVVDHATRHVRACEPPGSDDEE